uniref:Uncharacterized protein n=1 Tax=Coturnix japonica TaxID=93934 RepID=A0A8C2TMY1_COTJA
LDDHIYSTCTSVPLNHIHTHTHIHIYIYIHTVTVFLVSCIFCNISVCLFIIVGIFVKFCCWRTSAFPHALSQVPYLTTACHTFRC